MALPSNKSSSSPISSRPNPNSRNSEMNNPMRRSFSGNPFAKPTIVANPRGFIPNTPANSPSDFPRRNSIGRESMTSLHDHEDKENGKDPNLKQAKVRSPSVPKGTKNFMQPTISAASKVTASPKKKILADKNETIRSSVSFIDAKPPLVDGNDAKSEVGLNQMNLQSSYDSAVTDLDYEEALNNYAVSGSKVPLSSKNDFDSLPETPPVEKECVKLDPTFKISPSPPILAPLDADPLMPPYDPKTNYLSPRPQFLHYRPNPRIELYLNKAKDGKRLDESFLSECFSDTDITEATQSEDSRKEPEDSSSSEMEEKKEEEIQVSELNPDNAEVEEKEQEEIQVPLLNPSSVEVEEKKEEEIQVSKPNPSSINKVKEEIVETKVVTKSHFFTKSKLIALLLLLGICLLSITDSPAVDPFVLRELSLSKLHVPPEITELAKANFDGLAQSLRLWSASSFSYIGKLISNISQVQKPILYQHKNLTSFLEDGLVNGYKLGHTVVDPIKEIDIETQLLEEEEGVLAIDPDEEIEKMYPEIEEHEKIEEVLEEKCSTESEVVHQDSKELIKPDYSEAEKIHEEVEYSEAEIDVETQLFEEEERVLAIDPDEENEKMYPEIEEHENIEEALEEKCSTESEVVHWDSEELIKPDYSEAEKVHEEVEFTGHIDHPVLVSPYVEIEPKLWETGESETESVKAKGFADNSGMFTSTEDSQVSEAVDPTDNWFQDNFEAPKISGISLLVLSLIATTGFFYFKNMKPSTPNAVKATVIKKFDDSPVSISVERVTQERRQSLRNGQTEVDMVGEPCPSEMSSYQKSSSSMKCGHIDGTSEAHSQERRTRKNYRRESLASSSSEFSMGTPSYGSFTTYEKIPIKHVHGEDEVVTPVRRSSRIRNLVTSP